MIFFSHNIHSSLNPLEIILEQYSLSFIIAFYNLLRASPPPKSVFAVYYNHLLHQHILICNRHCKQYDSDIFLCLDQDQYDQLKVLNDIQNRDIL